MNKHLETFANLTGAFGIVLALLSGFLRVLGMRTLLDYELLSLLFAAIALMLASCVAQLYLLRNP